MTIDTSREAVERLLAERDAALAEVARLSTTPDDAETAELVADLRATADAVRSGDGHLSEEIAEETEAVADAITRLSHALAAETAKREAMEADRDEERKLADGLASAVKTHVHGWKALCVMSTHAARRKAETLAKHGSKT